LCKQAEGGGRKDSKAAQTPGQDHPGRAKERAGNDQSAAIDGRPVQRPHKGAAGISSGIRSDNRYDTTGPGRQ